MIAAAEWFDSETWRNLGSLGAAGGLVVLLWRLVSTMQTSVIGALRQRAADTAKDLHDCEARVDALRLTVDANAVEIARLRAAQIDQQGQIALLTAQVHRLQGDGK